MRLVLVLFFISGCGFHITSDPIEVNHNINFEELALYCQNACINDPNPKSCEEICYRNRIEEIIGAVNNGQI
jgi:hypothetical protein